jgi:tight adherence protein C
MSPQMMLYGGVAAAFVGLTAAVGIAAMPREKSAVDVSLAVISDMSARRAGDIDAPFGARVLTPAWQRLARIGRRLSPVGRVDQLRAKLDMAGSPPGWTVDRILAYKLIGLVGLALLALALFFLLLPLPPITAAVLAAGFAVLGYTLPNIVLYQVGYNRNETMRRQLPDAIDMLTISVEAGLSFDAAMTQVARNTTGPLAQEFFRVLQEMQIGLGRTDAFKAMAERVDIDEVRSFVNALVQADAFGIPIAHVLRVQAKEMRTKRAQRAEEQAQKVPVKILFPLIFCIMPALFVVVIGPAGLQIAHALFNK